MVAPSRDQAGAVKKIGANNSGAPRSRFFRPTKSRIPIAGAASCKKAAERRYAEVEARIHFGDVCGQTGGA